MAMTPISVVCERCGAKFVADTVACPFCNEPLRKGSSRFSGQIQGSDFDWREAAYVPITLFWAAVIVGLTVLVPALMIHNGVTALFVLFVVFFRQEWAYLIAKILLILLILRCVTLIILTRLDPSPVFMISMALIGALSGLVAYLIHCNEE